MQDTVSCQGWLSKALMRVVALMAFFCSIHSFLCNCGDRMDRLDRHLTSEGCNTRSVIHMMANRPRDTHADWSRSTCADGFRDTHVNWFRDAHADWFRDAHPGRPMDAHADRPRDAHTGYSRMSVLTLTGQGMPILLGSNAACSNYLFNFLFMVLSITADLLYGLIDWLRALVTSLGVWSLAANAASSSYLSCSFSPFDHLTMFHKFFASNLLMRCFCTSVLLHSQ